MRQCVLTKEGVRQVAWIDVQPASEGLYVDLKTDDGFDRN